MPYISDGAFHSYDGTDTLRRAPDGGRIDWAERANRVLQHQTERWVRMAIKAGPGWNVWRSHPRSAAGGWAIVHDFMLIAPNGKAPGAGIVFVQPDLTDGERVRILAGRHDWREQAWQDECGVADCGHKCCEDYRYGR